MASQVFLSLPKEKQELVVASALKEFSSQPYDKVSVFQIAKRAGISRAAFYSYFADKQDVYRHIINSIFKGFWDSVAAMGGVDITELALVMFDFFYRFKFTKTQDFITQLTANAKPDTMEVFLSFVAKDKNKYIAQETVERTRIRNEAELLDVCTLMATAAIYSLKEYYDSDLDPRTVRDRLERKVMFLTFGLVD